MKPIYASQTFVLTLQWVGKAQVQMITPHEKKLGQENTYPVTRGRTGVGSHFNPSPKTGLGEI